MLFLASIFNPSIQKNWASGQLKSQNTQKVSKNHIIKKGQNYRNRFMKFGLNSAYIPFSK